jgi:hypothetical protein
MNPNKIESGTAPTPRKTVPTNMPHTENPNAAKLARPA